MLIKGAKEFKLFKQDKPLTRKQAILAQCYICNGYEAEDCLGVSCPLYEYHPYRKVSKLPPLNRKTLNPKQLENLKQGREKRYARK